MRANFILCTLTLLLASASGTAAGDSPAGEPIFFIDGPSLIRSASDVIYKTYDDIPANGLVGRKNLVGLSCTPGDGRWPKATSTDYCQAPQRIPSPCTARLNFVIRSTIKANTTALTNGRCNFEYEYNVVSAIVYEDGEMELRRVDGLLKSGGTGDCSDRGPFYELEEIIERQQELLRQEFSSQ